MVRSRIGGTTSAGVNDERIGSSATSCTKLTTGPCQCQSLYFYFSLCPIGPVYLCLFSIVMSIINCHMGGQLDELLASLAARCHVRMSLVFLFYAQ